jgi:protein SCO1/2
MRILSRCAFVLLVVAAAAAIDAASPVSSAAASREASATAMRGARPAALQLTDQRGTAFSLAGLPARYLALTFVASRCSDACPMANALFAKLAARVAGSGRSLELVTVTLDPTFDTPFVMSRLSREFGADPSLWRFASGTPANVHALMRAFGVVARPDEHGVPDAHSTAVYILDRQRGLKRMLLLSSQLTDDVLAAVSAP